MVSQPAGFVSNSINGPVLTPVVTESKTRVHYTKIKRNVFEKCWPQGTCDLHPHRIIDKRVSVEFFNVAIIETSAGTTTHCLDRALNAFFCFSYTVSTGREPTFGSRFVMCSLSQKCILPFWMSLCFVSLHHQNQVLAQVMEFEKLHCFVFVNKKSTTCYRSVDNLSKCVLFKNI